MVLKLRLGKFEQGSHQGSVCKGIQAGPADIHSLEPFHGSAEGLHGCPQAWPNLCPCLRHLHGFQQCA